MPKQVDVGNAGIVARSDYAEILKKIIAEGHCPFCAEHLFKHHTKPILTEGPHWLVTENFKPYAGTRLHFLLISRVHVERIEDLPKGAGDELVEHYRYLSHKFSLLGATVIWRTGDMAMTGATVRHLHLQIVIGAPRVEGSELINVLAGFKVPS